ncbi:MAG TPA: copper homeostasis membrane protein CopD [Candidatus Methylomirabilis sp.]|nr:copper homeostasis membrane protein CopD [Candidatus Methylomirabilis sp.]
MIGLSVCIRFVHMGALTILLGAFAFLLLVARPAFSYSGKESLPAWEMLDRRLLALAGWSLLIALISGLMWLWVQAATVSGQPLTQALTIDTLSRVLTGTQFGRVWGTRLALLGLLGGVLLFRERERDDKDWRALHLEGVILGGGLMAALAWTGHAAATEMSLRPLHLTADAIHLLATGVWLGGLVSLLLLLRRARALPGGAGIDVAREATRRFSLLGLISVAALGVTGVVNGWILIGDVPHLVGTSYGRLLLGKLAVLLPLIWIAACNLLRVKPQLLAMPTVDFQDLFHTMLRRLTRNVLAEASLGAAILLIVGALGITAPARHVQPAWPFSFRLSWTILRNLPDVQQGVILAGAGVLFGLLIFAYGLLRPRYRAWAVAVGLLVVVFLGRYPLRHMAVDAYPTTYLRPSVPYQAASIAHGLRLYQENCAACHGVNGYGDGPAGQALRPRPADLTAKHTGDHTAGDLFWWLGHGIPGSAMPGFADRLRETDRWDLINFLRMLSAAEQARSLGPLVEPTPWLVAPDFTFGIGVGTGETLKDQRGKAMVHLVLFSLPGSLRRLDQLDAAWDTIAGAGARVIAVPMRDVAKIYQKLGMHAVNFPVAVDGSSEITETYTLFRRTLGSEDVPPIPDHMEFLIDRQGYIRARWIPTESAGWSEIPRLLSEIGRLDKEAPGAPAPEEHVH